MCPYCDGWEARDRRIVIYGALRKAVELAQELYQWTHALTVCGDGEEVLSDDQARWIACDAVFPSAALRQHSQIPRQLGCAFDGEAIRVDAEGRTSVGGCYAAGDIVTKHHQVITM